MRIIIDLLQVVNYIGLLRFVNKLRKNLSISSSCNKSVCKMAFADLLQLFTDLLQLVADLLQLVADLLQLVEDLLHTCYNFSTSATYFITC